MKKGLDGVWRTVGGVAVSERQQEELDAPSAAEQIATRSAELAEKRKLVVGVAIFLCAPIAGFVFATVVWWLL
jgi:hypothetical protein